MNTDAVSRRLFLKNLGIAGAAAYSAHSAHAMSITKPQSATTPAPAGQNQNKEAATRAQRMVWWHEARFGMFIHWGLYSLVGQHE